MTTKTRNPLRQGRRMRPTLNHRPAVWECLLGTVYAMNDAGEVRYFDFDYDAANEFAGVTADRDPRTFYCDAMSGDYRLPSFQTVLYVTKRSN